MLRVLYYQTTENDSGQKQLNTKKYRKAIAMFRVSVALIYIELLWYGSA